MSKIDLSYIENIGKKIKNGFNNVGTKIKKIFQPETQQESLTNEVQQPVDTYEQWLTKSQSTPVVKPQDTYNNTLTAIDNNKQAIIEQAELLNQQNQKNAEVEKQRAAVDAQSSYAKNLSTYGNNAEQVSSAGLQGSGYSDYLNAQAYATQRGEVQNANATYQNALRNSNYNTEQTKLSAEQQANSDKFTAETTYNEALKTEEDNRKSAYAELLSNANNGAFTKEQLSQLAGNYDLTKEEVDSVTAAADNYKSNTYKSNYGSVLSNIANGGEINSDYLDGLLESDSINQEQYDSLKLKSQNQNFDNFMNAIDDENVIIYSDDIVESYKKGNITKEQYDKISEKYNMSTDAEALLSDKPYDEAKIILEDVNKNKLLTDETKIAIKTQYKKQFASEIANELNKTSAKMGTATVDINSSGFGESAFGSYFDTGKSGTVQSEYINKIIADAKEGKIKEGQFINANYGDGNIGKSSFMYVGDGVFVKVDDSRNDWTGTYHIKDNQYIPSGYSYKNESKGEYNIKKN